MTSSTSSLRPLRLAFYGLAFVLGTLSTWYFNLRYLGAHGGDFALGPFAREAFVNDAAGSLGSDILVAGMAGVPFMVIEARRLGMRHGWIYAVLACTVAFASAFPLFLLMRELKLAQADGSALELARVSRAHSP